MDKRWMKMVAACVVLVGCGDNGGMPNAEPPVDGVAGAIGEPMAGVGGSVSNAGTSGEMMREECDPVKPTELPDAGMIDATAAEVELDASIEDAPTLADDDAGVDESMPPVETMADAGAATPASPRAPTTGEVVVSEVMADPTVLADSLGEWIELHNNTTVALDLTGCVVSDDRSDDFRVEALTLPAGGYVVLGRSEQAAPVVDLVYSGMVLANTADEIVVTCADTRIDRFAYGTGFPRQAGKSMQLDLRALNATDNDAPTSWCVSEASGTPGAANVACIAN